MSNITKEGIEVKPGQTWIDLDKRMSGRRVYVLAVENGKARVIHESLRRTLSEGSTKGSTSISVNRMHKSATGFQFAQV